MTKAEKVSKGSTIEGAGIDAVFVLVYARFSLFDAIGEGGCNPCSTERHEARRGQ